MTGADGQLELFGETANGHDDRDDLLAQIKALICKPGMSETSAAAVVEDALARGPRWAPDPPPLRPVPCRCHPTGQVLSGSPLCWRCGRTPGPVTGPVYVKPVGPTPRNGKRL